MPNPISAAKVVKTPYNGYFLVMYKLGESWRQLDRPFRYRQDAKRMASSILKSQGFSGLTNGGLG